MVMLTIVKFMMVYALGDLASATCTNDPYYASWSTGNPNGGANPAVMCDSGSFIRAITGQEQSGYGMVDLIVECSDGKTTRSTYNTNGKQNERLYCQEGFHSLQTREQPHYGVINWDVECRSGSTAYSNHNFNGKWNAAQPCSDDDVLVGLQTVEQRYGCVSARSSRVASDCPNP